MRRSHGKIAGWLHLAGSSNERNPVTLPARDRGYARPRVDGDIRTTTNQTDHSSHNPVAMITSTATVQRAQLSAGPIESLSGRRSFLVTRTWPSESTRTNQTARR